MHNTTPPQASRQRFVWFTHRNANDDKVSKLSRRIALWKQEKEIIIIIIIIITSSSNLYVTGDGVQTAKKNRFCQKLISLRGVLSAQKYYPNFFCNFISRSNKRDYFSAQGLFHKLRVLFTSTKRQVEKQQQQPIKNGKLDCKNSIRYAPSAKESYFSPVCKTLRYDY